MAVECPLHSLPVAAEVAIAAALALLVPLVPENNIVLQFIHTQKL